MAKILLVEDEVNVLDMTRMMLARAGHDVVGVPSGAEALAVLEAEGASVSFDVVLTDYRLNDLTGLDVLHAVRGRDSSVQVLLVTAYATTQTAVEAMRDGAFDYIEKPFKRADLLALIEKAFARRQAMRRPAPSASVPDFIAQSEGMKAVLDMVSRVAPTRANILITGESGTGKEVVARAIHRMSGIRGAFVPVNCGAIPENLIESEFFGYVKGAFTGATHDHAGLFQAASGGSLFLDEIGELPLSMQVKLLRAIQEKRIQPVGSTREVPVSVRILAATNRDLREEVEQRRFREDLFFRLNVIQIALPALRERREDIPHLISYFLRKFNAELGKSVSGVSRQVMDILMSHDYRGNVRELENIMEHAVTLEREAEIGFDSLPAYLKNSVSSSASGVREQHRASGLPSRCSVPGAGGASGEPVQCGVSSVSEPRGDAGRSDARASVSRVLPERLPEAEVSLGDGIALEGVVEELERRLIEQSLAKANGNKTEAARLLGISFRSLRYRLKKYGYE